jgi:outer membrane protein assembly factor BamB
VAGVAKANCQVIILITILLAPIFSIFSEPTVQASNSLDDWPMFHHDPAHTGVTSSAGPTKAVELWRFYVGGYINLGSSAAVVDGLVYVGANNNIYAIDAYTGSKLWKYSAKFGVQSSPAVFGSTVYIGADENVIALNAKSGAVVWSYPAEGSVVSSPAVVDGKVYIGSGSSSICALNAKTGSKLWNYSTSNGIDSSPAVVNGIVYFGSGDRNVYALNASTGEKIWNYTTGHVIGSSPAVSEGIVYIGSSDNKLYALNALTGEKLWSTPIHVLGDNELVESPSVADGVVYIGSEGFGLFANASTGAQIWNSYNSKHLSIVYSSAAIADGVVYVGATALNASTGNIIWNFPTGNKINASPAISNGVLCISSWDGYLYALGEPIIKPTPTPSILVNLGGSDLLIAVIVLALCVIAVVVVLFMRQKRGSPRLTQMHSACHRKMRQRDNLEA